MIQSIGMPKLIRLLLLLGLNVVAAFVFFTMLSPMRDASTAKLDSLEYEISRLQRDIAGVKDDMAQLQARLPEFESLRSAGFFNPQDRFVLNRELEALRQRTGLQSFSYDVGEIQKISSKPATEAAHELLLSRINIARVMSYTDESFLAFVQSAAEALSGHGRVAAFELSRNGVLDAQRLKSVQSGNARTLISASLTLDWLTMVPETAAPPIGGSGSGFRRR